MSAFAADLKVWLESPRPKPEMTDLAALAAELRRRSAPHIAAGAAVERRGAAAYALQERANRRLQPTTDLISASLPNVGSADGGRLTSLLATQEGFSSVRVAYRYAVGATVRGYAEVDPVLLRYGVLIEVLEHGNVRLRAGIDLGRDQAFGGDTWVGNAAEAPVDSLAAEAIVDAAVDELVKRLPEWVRRFAEETA